MGSEECCFSVIPIDGQAVDLCTPYTESLRYDGLTWSEAVELCRLSFMQGFQVVIWMVDECGEEEQTEAAITD